MTDDMHTDLELREVDSRATHHVRANCHVNSSAVRLSIIGNARAEKVGQQPNAIRGFGTTATEYTQTDP